ncbi:hypothetical protein ACFL53_00040 [Pseudomonadota bacterium]
MEKIFFLDDKIRGLLKERIPEGVDGIQVNTCKNPQCGQFGLLPQKTSISIIHKNGDSQHSKRDPHYAISGLGKGLPGLKCKACNQITPIKSNRCVNDELKRISAYLSFKDLSCPNESCVNHKVTISESSEQYYRYGSTNMSQRYQCKKCKKTFSTSSKRRKQRRSEINRRLYEELMNKAPVQRILEKLDISPSTFYHKVDWLHEQAMGFVRERELKLIESLSADRLYLSTDRQVLATNWITRKDKRNTELLGIATADNRSGYVFGWHFNYDHRLEPQEIENETKSLGDYDRPAPFRKYAHLWLEKDFEQATEETLNKKGAAGSLEGEIEENNLVTAMRNDMECGEFIDGTVKPPQYGMLIHSEYTMYAHFLLLKQMFKNIGKVRFFLDQEAGIRNAFVRAFSEEVQSDRADAFYVMVTKGMTVDNRKQMLLSRNARINRDYGVLINKSAPYSLVKEVAHKMTLKELSNLKTLAYGNEKWLKHPFPTMNEPEKMVAALTDLSKYTPEHQAHLYRMATLQGVDSFFALSRRRAYFFERPIAVASNARRFWYGYQPYNPAMLLKVAELFRLFHNYIHIPRDSKDKKTPAMRLGLAKGKIDYEDIIYFNKY